MDEGLSLVGFLEDLRSDLLLARWQAVEAAAQSVTVKNVALWFELGEVSLTVEVAHTAAVLGKASGAVEGKFWVFGSAKAAGEIGGEVSRTGTQTLTLKLNPRLDRVMKDDDGTTRFESTSVLITGALAEGEQDPDDPNDV